ncbi:MAG: DMT family transporter [Desulfobulbaceae bacterium]|nr:DMT family transporter [Desulfobulbaceae bacterium]
MQPQTSAYLFTVLTILFWGGAASAFKLALAWISPFTLLTYSCLLSFVFLLILLAFQGKLSEIARLPAQDLRRGLLLGIFNPFLYYIVLFKAYSLLPGQIAMALNYGWPLVLTLLSVPILGQKLSRSQLAAVGVSFCGAIIIATKGELTSFGGVSGLGILLAAVSTLIWALFWLVNARSSQDPVVQLFLGFSAALVCIILAVPLFGGLEWPPVQAILPLIYVGLFEMGLTFVLWLTALKRAKSAASIGNLVYCTPFLSLVFLHLIVGEAIHSATFIGLVLIVASLLFQEWQRAKKTS